MNGVSKMIEIGLTVMLGCLFVACGLATLLAIVGVVMVLKLVVVLMLK